VAVGFASTSPASVITNSPSLPPAGTYRTPADVHACFNTGGGLACVSNGNHFGFLNIIRTFPSGNEDETFNSQFTGNLQIGGGPINPISMTGQARVLVFGRPNDTNTGVFNTEMLALNLSGGGGFLIRESPTLASTGQTSITPIGGGQFQISSFFDVFTELSLDGGQTWTPSTGSAHVELVPEPGSMLLVAAGMLALIARKHRPV